jgi:nucleoside-diphosphate-sugar epimerase
MHELDDEHALTYQHVNLEGTRRLAEQAAEAQVKRLIYISSVKVLGESTDEIGVFNNLTPPNPQDAYARSKLKAENVLKEISNQAGMQLTILRPPLVYGPGVGANFLNLMACVARGIPLPLAAIGNQVSMIYVDNLADSVRACLYAPFSSGKTYLISDGAPISTASLISQLAYSLEVSNRSWALPLPSLLGIAKVFGRVEEMRRITKSLVIDDRDIRNEIGWQPPFTMAEGLSHTAKWFREAR